MCQIDRRVLVPAVAWLAFVLGCGQQAASPTFDGPPTPSGTKVSGSCSLDVVSVAFRNVDSGQEIRCQSGTDGGKYEWALPPGKYEVIAYNPGGDVAVVKEVTVGNSPVVVDIPDSVQYKPAPKAKAEPKGKVAADPKEEAKKP